MHMQPQPFCAHTSILCNFPQDDTASVSIDGHEKASVSTKGKAKAGYAGIGTGGYYYAQFDDFYLLEGTCLHTV